jgi:glutamine synthetase/predicted TIM-barrel fold metal-dependent hydrolase
MSITTEAAGDAIHAATTSLSHLRGVRQLASLLKCGYTWEAVVAAIEQKRLDSHEDWIAQCLSGIETILIDDGLDDQDDVHDYAWHDDYTRTSCKRIVRIEKVAADIINQLGLAYEPSSHSVSAAFDKTMDEFAAQINHAIEDDDVVGFKSVICYRTGLDIPESVDMDAARATLGDILVNFASVGSFDRLQHEHLNNLFVHRTAELIAESSSRQKKPIQFHTGLGDNDITLATSSPAHLQPFIRVHPTVPIVLLHASYPFVRESGYLASVYDNVYADIGEVFPFVSQDGQERVLRQILELCPWSKILWSTDGHWFPETYVLAIMQMREVLEMVSCILLLLKCTADIGNQVLRDYVRKGHIGWRAAIELVRDVLFRNSNKLYHLGLEFSELEDENDTELGAYPSDAELLQSFIKDQEQPDFVRICWTDLTATPRMRMVPFRKFMSLLQDGKPTDIGITKAVFGVLQNDWLTPGFSATGEYRLHPDFSSLKKGPIEGHISMYAEFREKSGAPVSLCPRSLLQRAVEFGNEAGLTFLLGFEIEFLLAERVDKAGGPMRYGTLTTDGHAWSISRYFADANISRLLRDMVSTLDDMGIFVEQLHAESATGQFELILPPLTPVEAVDTLLHTRDVMNALATAAGFRMTLHPKPFANACGTAAHAHMSISSPKGAKTDVYESFYAGILKHLRGITAFTYTNPASFERLSDGVWAGGRWVTWGTQNREAALRKIEDSHWEVRVSTNSTCSFSR